jgi:hypothetical protein
MHAKGLSLCLGVHAPLTVQYGCDNVVLDGQGLCSFPLFYLCREHFYCFTVAQ